MALTSGTRVGVYEVIASIGVGGMGEVFRARDTKLNRDVALKVLPDSVANDADRLARFTREAQTLAALNHPNIAHIHGLEESCGVRALVMELVEGEDLSQRIARGTMPLDEALVIAKQIAEALEAAHEQGIIHRDLKPANVKVRPDGTVKVLDFGLAKAIEPVVDAPPLSQSPTITTPAMLTGRGMLLGTAAYMAPEQARGKAVDKRADIWAFGCVLFEMLAGVSAFGRDDMTDTIAAVVTKEPDWQALTTAASGMRPLLARCLKKDPKQRLQAIGDARIQIEEMIAGTSEESVAGHGPARSPRVAWAAVAGLAFGAVMAALMTWALTRSAPEPQVLPSRFEIVPPPEHALSIHTADRNVAISPDGRHIVYRAGPPTQLVVRAIDRLDAHPLEGTAGARYPFFSPDGQWVGFFDGATLKKVSLAGGPAIPICQSGIPRGASWGDDDAIVFATQDTATGLLRVPARGGEPTVLTKPDTARRERDHFHPSLLPKGRGILFTIAPSNPAEPWQVAVLDLKTGERKTVILGSQPEYVETGHLLYVVAGTMSAVRFDLARLEVVSDPMLVIDDVGAPDRASADYTVSRRGTLVHVKLGAADAPRSLVWVDRTGSETPIGAPLHIYATPRLSPDGTRIAVTIREQQNDIHVFDLKRGTLLGLASSPSVESGPIWTPNGKRIVFASERNGPANLYAQAADGTGRVERLTIGPDSQLPAWVAADDSGILGSEISPTTAGDVVWFPLQASSNQSASSTAPNSNSPVDRLVHSPAIEFFPEVSRNGRYVAYQSNESGSDEIFVRPFPRVNDGFWKVSTGGGTRPAWAINGRELFYLDPTNALTAVPVQTTGPTFVFGNSTKLPFGFIADKPGSPRDYDVAQDGRFLTVKRHVSGDRKPAVMVVVLNSFEELKRLLPAK